MIFCDRNCNKKLGQPYRNLIARHSFSKVSEGTLHPHIKRLLPRRIMQSISMISTREYIKKCVGILDYEVEIAKRFLPETVETVVDTLRDNLINCHFAVQEHFSNSRVSQNFINRMVSYFYLLNRF